MQAIKPLAAYPMQTHMPVRYGDMDANHHLNNVAQARLFEEGSAVLQRRAIADSADASFTVAQHTIRYLAIGSYPATLQLGSGIVKLGNSSFEIEQLLAQDGRPIATCHTVLVHMQDKHPAPLPPHWRAALANWMIDNTAT